MRPTLVVFVKEPRPGLVKTRLAREIGTVEAAWWVRHQSARLIRAMAADRRWRTVLAVTPDAAGLRSRAWPAELPRIPQGAGDLGRRMLGAIRAAGRPAAVIGTDLPGLRPGHVAAAFRLLRAHDAVLGPAADGGYWFIGLGGRRPVPPGLLDGVRWSTPHALADTLARLGDRRVGIAATLRDVDSLADLRAARNGRIALPNG